MAGTVVDAGRYPGAVWDPITGRPGAANRPVRMTIHTAWADSGDIYGPGFGPGGTFAHFHNPTSGKIRQHQEIHRIGYSDLQGNGTTIGVEHQDERRDMPLSKEQIDADARLFAYLVARWGVPNRIATPDDTRGLAWHRLGCRGNYGRFDRNDMTTWSGAQTGVQWSTALGKTCPTNPRIRQIPAIFALAQTYLDDYRKGTDTPSTPAPPKEWFDMPIPDSDLEKIADAVWRRELGGRTAGERLRSLVSDVWGRRVKAYGEGDYAAPAESIAGRLVRAADRAGRAMVLGRRGAANDEAVRAAVKEIAAKQGIDPNVVERVLTEALRDTRFVLAPESRTDADPTTEES